MTTLASPFTVSQKIIVPAGTQQTMNGVMSQTTCETTVTVRRSFTGYIEMTSGFMVAHPPLIVGVVGDQAAVYEVSPDLLQANGIESNHSLYGTPPKILVV